MTGRAAILLGSVLLAGMAGSEPLPPLPVWSPTDFENLEKGVIIPGAEFFGKPTSEEATPAPLPPELVPEIAAEEAGPEVFPTEIAAEDLERYFGGAPGSIEGTPQFLIDPQELLAQQESRDRESFLQYHAGESGIDIYVYLFDARQELPSDVSIEGTYEKFYRDRGACALVFYHLGMPDRSQLLLSREVRAVASQDEQTRALRAAVQEAFEKSDAAHQLDNFLVELSIRLYWIERRMAGVANGTVAPVGAAASTIIAVAGTNQRDQTWSLISRMLILAGVLVMSILLVWLGIFLADRRVRHVFPEVECGPLLGAPHAAGVGAVLSFSNAQIPPSQQRDQVPDYLQRM